MPGSINESQGLLIVRVGDRLGALAEVRRRLLDEPGAAIIVDRKTGDDAEAKLLGLGEALRNRVSDVAICWDVKPGRTVDIRAADLIGAPGWSAGAAIAGGVVERYGLPDFGPPDLFLEDHGPWAIVASLLSRGANGVGVGVGMRGRGVAPMTRHGAAWLAERALAWGASEAVARETWLSLTDQR